MKSTLINDGVKNYISIELNSTNDINNYQLNTLRNVEFDFLLPLTLKNKDDIVSLNFCIDSKTSLKKHLELHGKMNFAEFTRLMLAISDILLNKRQQLTQDFFVLSKEFIYLDSHKSVHLIFVPDKAYKGRFGNALSKLVQELIPLWVRYSEAEDCYTEMLTASELDNFNLKTIEHILNKYTDSVNEKSKEGNQEPVLETPKQIPKVEIASNGTNSNQKTTTSNMKTAKLNSKNASENSKTVTPNLKVAVPNSETGYSNAKMKAVIGLIQVLFIMLIVLLLLIFQNQIIKVIFVAGLLVFLDIFIVWRLLKTKPLVQTTVQAQDAKPTKIKSDVKSGSNVKKTNTGNKKDHIQSDIVENHVLNRTSYFSQPDQDSPLNRTQYLGHLQPNAPGRIVKLVSQNGTINYDLDFNRNMRIILGRGENCHVKLNDGTISGEHAVIRLDGQSFFIEDLNSLNGTKLNNVRLTGGLEFSLTNSDEISFAELTFKFIL